jgi:hypothetical protein
MPTLNWIGKEAVVNHHHHVPFHLLKDVPDLAAGDRDDAVQLIMSATHKKQTKLKGTRISASVLREDAPPCPKHAEVTVPSLDDWENEWQKNLRSSLQLKLLPVGFRSPLRLQFADRSLDNEKDDAYRHHRD